MSINKQKEDKHNQQKGQHYIEQYLIKESSIKLDEQDEQENNQSQQQQNNILDTVQQNNDKDKHTFNEESSIEEANNISQNDEENILQDKKEHISGNSANGSSKQNQPIKQPFGNQVREKATYAQSQTYKQQSSKQISQTYYYESPLKYHSNQNIDNSQQIKDVKKQVSEYQVRSQKSLIKSQQFIKVGSDELNNSNNINELNGLNNVNQLNGLNNINDSTAYKNITELNAENIKQQTELNNIVDIRQNYIMDENRYKHREDINEKHRENINEKAQKLQLINSSDQELQNQQEIKQNETQLNKWTKQNINRLQDKCSQQTDNKSIINEQQKQLQSKPIQQKVIPKPLQPPKLQQQRNLQVQNEQIITIKQVQQYPSLDLCRSYEQPKRIQIIDYHCEHFLRMQTQIYNIQVHEGQSEYMIQRRYSDFRVLYQTIRCNHLGYILQAFPQKNIQNFIILKLSYGNVAHRQQLIQQRMYYLEQFVNKLLCHQELRNTQQVHIFLSTDLQKYQRDKNRVEKYMHEYQQLENGSQIQQITQNGYNYLQQLIGSRLKQKSDREMIQPIMKQDNFESYLGLVDEKYKSTNRLLLLYQQLVKVEKQQSQYNDLQTDIDALLQLSAKLISGRQYSNIIMKWMNNQVIDQLLNLNIKLKQVLDQLLYRIHLINRSTELFNENQKREKILRRIQRFQRNFQSQWNKFIQDVQNTHDKISSKFITKITQFKSNMNKIWNK